METQEFLKGQYLGTHPRKSLMGILQQSTFLGDGIDGVGVQLKMKISSWDRIVTDRRTDRFFSENVVVDV